MSVTFADRETRAGLQTKQATLASLLARAAPGLRFNEHLDEADGPLVFQHACKLGLEGIVSKRRDSRYRSGRSPDWIKSNNPAAPAAKREAEEEWVTLWILTTAANVCNRQGQKNYNSRSNPNRTPIRSSHSGRRLRVETASLRGRQLSVQCRQNGPRRDGACDIGGCLVLDGPRSGLTQFFLFGIGMI